MMKEPRCIGCDKKLAEALTGGQLIIKCSRCKVVNIFEDIASPIASEVALPA